MMMVEVAVSHAKDVKEAKMNMKNDTQASDYCMSTSFAFAATRWTLAAWTTTYVFFTENSRSIRKHFSPKFFR